MEAERVPDWQTGTCAICNGAFLGNRDVERANGNLYHRSCARRAGIRRKYRGVTFVAGRGKWLAYISGHKFRGPFSTEDEAAQVYNEMAVAYYGDKAKLNQLPDDPPPPGPEEISVACAKIRSHWAEQDYADRAPHLAALPVPELWPLPSISEAHTQ